MRKILLVEDEDLLREAYRAILASGSYEVYAAANGREALELCKQIPFDLVLLDLMMPVMDGIGFLEQRLCEACLPTKVVILSNLSSSAELARALSLGASKSILKAELSPHQLLSMVRDEVVTA
jgi:CheY-like chemotaxis protein